MPDKFKMPVLIIIIAILFFFAGIISVLHRRTAKPTGNKSPDYQQDKSGLKPEKVKSGSDKNAKERPKELIQIERVDNWTEHFKSIEYQKKISNMAAEVIEEVKNRQVPASLIIKEMEIKRGDFVADIGSGFGPLAFPISQHVGPKGRVFSVEVDDFVLLYQLKVRRKMAMKYGEKGSYYENITPILDDFENLTLPPDLLDHAFTNDVHGLHFDPKNLMPRKTGKVKYSRDEIIERIYNHEKKFMKSVYISLKPGGKFAVIEDNPEPEKYGVLDAKGVIKLMKKMGFKLHKQVVVKGHEYYDFLIFEKIEGFYNNKDIKHQNN